MQAVSEAGQIPGREEMVARAAALTPRVAERAEEVERTREIHPDTVEDFWETGLWSILKPRRYGGLELDYGTVIDIPDRIARGCASTGLDLQQSHQPRLDAAHVARRSAGRCVEGQSPRADRVFARGDRRSRPARDRRLRTVGKMALLQRHRSQRLDDDGRHDRGRRTATSAVAGASSRVLRGNRYLARQRAGRYRKPRRRCAKESTFPTA